MAAAAHAHDASTTGSPVTLLCALTGGEHDEQLVQTVRRLAGSSHLRPRFVHVGGGSVWAARSMLRQAGARTQEMRVEVGDAGTALLRAAAEEHAALIVIGVAPGTSTSPRAVLRRLIEHAPAPVLFLPPTAESVALADAAALDAGPRAVDLVEGAERPLLVVPR